ncbi:MAG: hypothetical protein WCG86_05485 [Actinomycetota bacterium]
MSDVSNETVQQIENTLNEVDRALDRLRSGTYRACEVCGSEIEENLLAADALRASCVAHPRLPDAE